MKKVLALLVLMFMLLNLVACNPDAVKEGENIKNTEIVSDEEESSTKTESPSKPNGNQINGEEVDAASTKTMFDYCEKTVGDLISEYGSYYTEKEGLVHSETIAGSKILIFPTSLLYFYVYFPAGSDDFTVKQSDIISAVNYTNDGTKTMNDSYIVHDSIHNATTFGTLKNEMDGTLYEVKTRSDPNSMVNTTMIHYEYIYEIKDGVYAIFKYLFYPPKDSEIADAIFVTSNLENLESERTVVD